MEHLFNDKLLSLNQHGFVNKMSTDIQLLNYLDKASDSIADGNVVDVI